MKDLLFEILEKSKEEAKKLKQSAEEEYKKKKELIEKNFKEKTEELKNSLNLQKEKELEQLKNELEMTKKSEILKEIKKVKEECIQEFNLTKKEKETFFQIIKEKIKELEKTHGKKYKAIGNKESLETLGLKGEINEQLSPGVILDYGNFRVDLTLNNFLNNFKNELEKV
jgi:vacuolar-type H+-ATPase subunit E/Vma4